MRSAAAQHPAPSPVNNGHGRPAVSLVVVAFVSSVALLSLGLLSHGLCDGEEMRALDRVLALQGDAVADVRRSPWLPTALTFASVRALPYLPPEISLRIPSLLGAAGLGVIAMLLLLRGGLGPGFKPWIESGGRTPLPRGHWVAMLAVGSCAMLITVTSVGTFLDSRSIAGALIGELFVSLAIVLAVHDPSPSCRAETGSPPGYGGSRESGEPPPTATPSLSSWPRHVVALLSIAAAVASIGIVLGAVLPLAVIVATRASDIAATRSSDTASDSLSGSTRRLPGQAPHVWMTQNRQPWIALYAALALLSALLAFQLARGQGDGYIPLLGAARDLGLAQPAVTRPWSSIVDSLLLRSQPWFPLVLLGLALPGATLARIWIGVSLAMGALWSSIYGDVSLPVAVPCALAAVQALSYLATLTVESGDGSDPSLSHGPRDAKHDATRELERDSLRDPSARGRALILVLLAGVLVLRRSLTATTVIVIPGICAADTAGTSLSSTHLGLGLGPLGLGPGLEVDAAALTHWHRAQTRPLELVALVLLVLLISYSVAPLAAWIRRSLGHARWLTLLALPTGLGVLAWQVAVLSPTVERLASARSVVASAVRASLAPGASSDATLLALGELPAGLRYYLHRATKGDSSNKVTLMGVDSLEQLQVQWASAAPDAEVLALIPRRELAHLHRERRLADAGFAVLSRDHEEYALVSNQSHLESEDLDPARGVRLEGPCPLAHAASTNFADTVELVGWEFSPTPRRGSAPTLSLCLRVLKPPPANLRIVVHLEHGKRSRSIDRPTIPTLGAYPTYAWRSDDLVLHRHRIEMSVLELSAGPHDLVLGISRGEEQLLKISDVVDPATTTGERVKSASRQWVILDTVDVR